MRLIRYSFAVLVFILVTGVVLAQDSQPEPRAANTYSHGGEFDSYTGYLTYWKVIEGAAKDNRICGGVGYNGSNCAFQFYGNKTEKTRLTQNTPINFLYGSTEPHYGFLSAQVKPTKGEVELVFVFTFTFKDGSPAIKTNYTYTGTGPAEEYEAVYFETASSFNPNKIKAVKINIRNLSPFRTTVYVDSVNIGINVAEPDR